MLDFSFLKKQCIPCEKLHTMLVQNVIDMLEEMAPLHYAEDFDNVGLLVGTPTQTVSNVLVTLDTLETVIDEAIEKNCNLIVSFHPIVFKGLKKINGNNYVERVIIKAIQHNIAIFAIHTALDNHWQGVNHMICEKLGLSNQQILIPKKKTICKLNTFVPNEHLKTVQEALFNAGAGSIGNYENCSFHSQGKGSFKGNANSNPVVGEKLQLHEENESQLQITFATHLRGNILKALHNAHPYEEVAYEITTLENSNQKIGMGMIGELPEAMPEKECLQLIKDTFNAKGIRHSAFLNKPIKRIAVLGGSGAFAINNAKRAGVDLFITADIKYHEFYQAENSFVIADIGHYESEQYTKNLIVSHLRKKISNFAPAFDSGNIVLSDKNTNPIKYF